MYKIGVLLLLGIFTFSCAAAFPQIAKAQKLRVIETSWKHANPENVEGFSIHCGKTSGRYDLVVDTSLIESSTQDPNLFKHTLQLKTAYKCFMVTARRGSLESNPSNESCVK